jgi:hypothetical protein
MADLMILPLSGDIIAPDDEPFTIHAIRYNSPMTLGATTLEEAVRRCFWAVDDNTYWPSHITNLAGEVVLANEQLREAIINLDQE